jgi:hypothetical protein
LVKLQGADSLALMGSLGKLHPGPVRINQSCGGIVESPEFRFHGSQRSRHLKLRFDKESADKNNQQTEEQK